MPGSGGMLTGAFCRTNSTWNSDECRASRFGADRLHDPLERHVLVARKRPGSLPRPPEQFAEGRIAGEVAAEHQRVDDEPDQPFDAGPVAVGDRRADADVVLPGVAVQAASGTRPAAS